MEQSVTSDEPSSIYTRLDAYDWAHDPEFQTGLSTILRSAPQDQAPRLALRARCYYFARKFGERVDFEGYLNWKYDHANGAGVSGGGVVGQIPQSGMRAGTDVPGDLAFVTGATDPSSQSSSQSQAQQSQPPSQPQPPSHQPQPQQSPSSSTTIGDAPPPATFASICDLIAAGKPIPGIKEIPDIVLEGQASTRTAVGRRKPWERYDGGVEDGGTAPAVTAADVVSDVAADVPVWARKG